MKAILLFTGPGCTGTCVVAVANVPAPRVGTAQTPAPAPLEVPARTVPVPTTVSPEMQALIGAPLSGNWNVVPKSAEEWKTISAGSAGRGLPALREKFSVKSESMTVNGVQAYLVTPQVIPPENRNRLLIHVHGGCYVLSGGEAGTTEAIYMAGFGRFKVLSIDYRRPPEFPYPAALDDGDRGVEGSPEDGRAEEHGDLRHVSRRRPDVVHGAASEAGTAAAAGRHRAGDADVRSHQDRRLVLHQLHGGQRAGGERRPLRCDGQALCERARSEGPDAVAGLRRHAWLSARRS